MGNGSSASLTPVQIPFRRNETMYVLPQTDRIVIVYSVCFDDKTDQAIARIFLQVLISIDSAIAFNISLGINAATGIRRHTSNREQRTAGCL